MTQSPIDSLLQASLSQHQPKRPMYSVTAHALVAFFGGPVALVLFSGLSVHHIGLLRPHLKYYILLLLGVLGVTYFMSFWLVTGWPDWLRTPRIPSKICAAGLAQATGFSQAGKTSIG